VASDDKVARSRFVARVRGWVTDVRADVVEAYRTNTLGPAASDEILDALDELERVTRLVELGTAEPSEAEGAHAVVRALALDRMGTDPGEI
jgi:hypothetical protein